MRSRRNNTTLTRKVDKWNTRKVWLIKRYADGHYAINQEVGGRVFIPASSGPPRRRSRRSSPAADSQAPRPRPGQDERSKTMTYDPNVFGYVDGQPTYSRDEFIYKKRRRGPITDDAELVAFAEKVTSGWYNAGWHQTFTTYYLGDYALSEPLDSMTIKRIQPAEGSPEGGATRGRSRRGRPLLAARRDTPLGRQQCRGSLQGQGRKHQARHDGRPARRRLLKEATP